jgi:SWI/SNF-related matrix-associated actin-dependent regulator 1 of chromatin subfamily A
LNAVQSFLSWYEQTDPAAPNDRQFLARLTKVRTQLHAAKQYAIAERIEDIVACGEKVVVFTCYQAGIERHKKAWDDAAVTITGADSVEARQAAVDRFQDDPQIKVALCNIIAGGVGIRSLPPAMSCFRTWTGSRPTTLKPRTAAIAWGKHKP